jgi:hypothetical protein
MKCENSCLDSSYCRVDRVIFQDVSLAQSMPPNTACTRLGVRTAFFEVFRGFGGIPFRG